MLYIFTRLADWLIYDIAAISSQTHLGKALHFFVEDITKIFFLLFVLVFLMGVLRTWLDTEKIKLWLQGRSRFIGYLLAVCLGAITPFCTCSGIPLFLAFLSAGIPLGVTMAFLITSPMINEVAAILFAEAIGLKFMWSYLAVGMGVGLFGGWLVDALKLDKWVEPFVFDIAPNAPDTPTCGCKDDDCCTTSNLTKMPFKSRLSYGWDEALNIIKCVWLYLIIGVGVGAGLHGFVPQTWFVEHAGADNIFAVPLAVIMAVPLYSNCTAVVPVAEVLISKGLPVGTTLAFIMSTVAISLPELVILRKVLKLQMIGFFVAFLAVAFTLVGYGFNAFF